MLRSSCVFAWISALLICLNAALLPASAQINTAGSTNMILYNASNADVTVLFKSQGPGGGVGDGCAFQVNQYNILDLATKKSVTVTPFSNPQTGWFILKRGARVQVLNKLKNPYTGQPSTCIQGFNFTFGATFTCPDGLTGNNAFPNTTPGPKFNQQIIPPLKNGSNAFEGSLNMPGTIAGVFAAGALNEAIDISCVNGANSILEMTITPPNGGPYWSTQGGTAGGGVVTYKGTTTTRNSWVDVTNMCDANCIDPATGFARPGIYPYGCSLCNVFPDPAPPCSGQQFCNAKNGVIGNNGCNYTRSALKTAQPAFSYPPIQRFGGTVQVTYKGPAIPPGTCPPGTKQ